MATYRGVAPAEADPAEPATVSELEAKPSEITTRSQKIGGARFIDRTCPRRFRPWETVSHGKDAMLRCQYKQLRVLEALDVPGLRVPNTLRRSPAKRLLLIEFVPGNTIETLGLPDPVITT